MLHRTRPHTTLQWHVKWQFQTNLLKLHQNQNFSKRKNDKSIITFCFVENKTEKHVRISATKSQFTVTGKNLFFSFSLPFRAFHIVDSHLFRLNFSKRHSQIVPAPTSIRLPHQTVTPVWTKVCQRIASNHSFIMIATVALNLLSTMTNSINLNMNWPTMARASVPVIRRNQNTFDSQMCRTVLSWWMSSWSLPTPWLQLPCSFFTCTEQFGGYLNQTPIKRW